MRRILLRVYDALLEWRAGHIKERDFIIVLSVLVGIVSGLATMLLHFSVHSLCDYVSEVVSSGTSFLYFIVPLVGILLTALFVKYVVRDDISHGVTKVLYAISRKNSVLRGHNMYSSMIGSTLTIGFGGSVGTEATIVLTGGALGSNLARFFKMNYKVMTLMIGCGAAAAIAGIFKAPIAGIAFTLEVLMIDMTMASMLPLMISAMVSYVLVFFATGGDTFLMLNIDNLVEIQSSFEFVDVMLYIALGVMCGLVSVYFIRTNIWVEKQLKNIKNSWVRIVIGGILLGGVITLFPMFYGEGYSSLKELLLSDQNSASEYIMYHSIFRDAEHTLWLILLYTVGLVFLKVVATALTNGSGGVGGVFAPSLFTGGLTGFLFVLITTALGVEYVPVSLFVLAGMAGVMSGVMSSPLTAMFLIAEMTGCYFLLVPFMLTSAVAYLTCRGMEPHSIYARRLAKMGELITHNKDRAVLTLMRLENVIETDFVSIRSSHSLGTLVSYIATAKRNIFPVVGKGGGLVGIVLLDDVRKVMFQSDLYDKLSVSDFMCAPIAIIDITDSMEIVTEKFEKSKAWNLPVVKDGKYIGFVSKSRIFEAYRDVLKHQSED
ncbi:MAG: chloride channel protein [Bacteroidales bacterium]|nr:chloride channel protein [Bacteroidales bacterium]